MRGRRAAAGIAVVLGLTLMSACKPGGTSDAGPGGGATPVVSVSPDSPSPIPTSTATSGFRPGSATMGDPLFPASGNGGYDVTHYAITVRYNPATKTLTGDDVITATATQDLSRFDLDLHGLTVSSVTVGGRTAAATRSADKLQITPATGINMGRQFTTEIKYGGTPGHYSDPILGTEGFMTESPGALAQGEPDVAASWFPVNDHPRDKATYDITITAPSNLSALSNGVLKSRTTAGTETTWHWSEGAPMASYLATVVIGDYRVVTSTHNGLPVVLAVDKSLPKYVDANLARTPEIIDFLATQFGPYPFDAMGGIVQDDPRIRFALENQSRPVYSNAFFQQPGDDSEVIAHELAHQWYGDSVSVANWPDVWLNEGFATYAEWLWEQHVNGVTPKQAFDRVYPALPADPPGDPTVATLFGNSVYTRGAATLEALRISVGDTAFFSIIRTWAAKHRYGNGSTAQFITLADQISGKKLDAFFKSWLFENGKPPYPKPMN